MNKLFTFCLSLLLLLGAATIPEPATAQRTPDEGKSGYLISNTNQTRFDTTSNATTKSQRIRIAGHQDVVSFQVVLSRISGTAAGKVTLWGSLDGTNFTRLGGKDSLTVTNQATITEIFDVIPSRRVFYEARYTGSGTMAVRWSTLAIWRKE